MCERLARIRQSYNRREGVNMSFSSEVKRELSSINTYSKSNLIEAELIGYLMSANIKEENEKIEFITENEFNIERIYKILFKLKIEYEPETRRKTFVAKINKPNLRNIENFKNTCTVMNGTLAWDISGKMDESDCIDIDPFTLYELKAINSLIA